ncbi:hypothetical protein HXA31_20305 [Salipaludibacillus agaradhaerens]|uniref:Uncharacterized protein n=1 Tax=Salipaludibacillus agaradhaerens TaxID=76935 RepID=A0A9Q4FZM9_SALAG|nr:hypothetical protein [Salipaludibacillus agaradhaerens]MCR6096904.1 hypothetical protein [Salipaludibacillus agaradhaerens]MCR6116674.1 hypothetical protein [Salipaludibacillus agaradhaerens]
MKKLEIIESKGLEDVKVFRVCECDAVAAYSLDEAIEFYKEFTGLEDDDLYDYEAIEVIGIENEFYDDEDRKVKKKLKDMVRENWDGKPFIVLTWDY